MSKILNIPDDTYLPNLEDKIEVRKLKDLIISLTKELRLVKKTLNFLINGEFGIIQLGPQHKEPLTDQKKTGTIAYADGTDWNPGSGQGVYRYSSAGTWVFLG